LKVITIAQLFDVSISTILVNNLSNNSASAYY
jgi:hypothetical protein